MKIACLLVGGTYMPGDLPPEGYLQKHEWADVQLKSGLRQKECGKCSKWKFPQELSDKTISYKATKKDGLKITITEPICLKCAE